MVAAAAGPSQANAPSARSTLAATRQAREDAMGFNPNTGMTPNDWVETEARREERVQRADRRHGREMSRRSRSVVGWVLGLAAMALIAYAVLGWISIMTG
jgi:hypothetical protein